MTLPAAKLDKRIQIRAPEQTPDATTGGMTRTYEPKATLWARLTPMSSERVAGAMHVRNVQTQEIPTHIFRVRRDPYKGIDVMGTSALIRSDHYIYMDTGGGNGRSFRIMSTVNVKEENVFLDIIVREEEMQEVSSIGGFIS